MFPEEEERRERGEMKTKNKRMSEWEREESVTDLSVKNNLFLKKTPLTQQQLLIKTTTIYTHMEDKQ